MIMTNLIYFSSNIYILYYLAQNCMNPFLTRRYTRQHQLRAGGQGQYGSWAGAVTEICSPFSSKRPKTRSDFGRTDRRTDRQTDRHSDL